jgi:hypothetical protein
MRALFRRVWHDPVLLLALSAGLLAFVVQSGELGSADTQHRLNSTHALWTSAPPVFPAEYPEFGVHGRDGKLQSWYGIGQSLLMLPADLVGTATERLPAFRGYEDDPSVRNIVVSYSTNILVTVLTALLTLRFLRQFGFTLRQAIAGVFALLVSTTHLHYTQNMMENNYIFLLTLAGFSYEYEWVRTQSRRALLLGSGALGLNLLTRITTGMDLLAGILFVLLVPWFEGCRGRALRARVRGYFAVAVPVFALFGLLDRLYQFYRFGSLFNTYVHVAAQEMRQRNPSLPANYPFETPFHVGFFGALFSPEKSIFLFDPLLILGILVAVVLWKRLTPEIRAFSVAAFLMLLAYLSFYARYTVWSGDFAWGDRYVSTAVEFAALLAIPLLLRYRERLGGLVFGTGMSLLAASTVIQIASLAFWMPLEIYQMDSFGHPTFVIALRMKNIVAFGLGKMHAWRLVTPDMTYDAWDYVHITTWNFLPFLLKRVGAAPAWVVDVAFVLWGVALLALALVGWRLWRVLAQHDLIPAEPDPVVA